MIGSGGRPGDPGPGNAPINKFGVNYGIDTTTTPETIWSHGGQFPFIDVGIPMDIVSTNAADNISGIGAQKALLTFYRTDNTEVMLEVDLAGLSRVQIDDDVKLCTRIKISQTGSTNTNSGEINLVDRATGLVVYQSVEIGTGQTLSTVQICPKDKKGLIRKHSVTYAKDQSPLGSADMEFNLRKANGSIQLKHPTVISSIKPKDEYCYEVGGIKMEEGDIAYWQCISVSANNTPIEGRFDVRFEDV